MSIDKIIAGQYRKQKKEHNTMGRISEIVKNSFKQKKSNKLVSFSEVTEIKAALSEMQHNLKAIASDTGFDTNHKIYVLTQNMLSYFAEELSVWDELEDYYDQVSEVQDNFLPNGPPMSPLTGSYFTLWCFCDLRFGEDNETIAWVFSEVGLENDMEEILVRAAQELNKSYMAFYRHMGFEDELILLKDIISDKTYSCVCPAGYQGEKDQIWYVRLVPNLDPVYNYHIVINTPYIITQYNESVWRDYFQRQGVYAKADHLKYRELLKHPVDANFWHNYLLDAYVDYDYSSIRLTGIPDIRGSKPHEMNI